MLTVRKVSLGFMSFITFDLFTMSSYQHIYDHEATVNEMEYVAYVGRLQIRLCRELHPATMNVNRDQRL